MSDVGVISELMEESFRVVIEPVALIIMQRESSGSNILLREIPSPERPLPFERHPIHSLRCSMDSQLLVKRRHPVYGKEWGRPRCCCFSYNCHFNYFKYSNSN